MLDAEGKLRAPSVHGVARHGKGSPPERTSWFFRARATGCSLGEALTVAQSRIFLGVLHADGGRSEFPSPCATRGPARPKDTTEKGVYSSD